MKERNWEQELADAKAKGKEAVREFLIETDNDGCYCLHQMATTEVSPKVFLDYIEAGANIHARDDQNSTPLHWAADWGRPELVQILLDKGADVNAVNDLAWTPLHGVNDKRTAEILIEAGADVHAKEEKDRTPLHITEDKDVTALLIEKGADIESRNRADETPLMRAVIWGKPSLADVLVKKGADLGVTNENGLSLLQIAVSTRGSSPENKEGCVDVLLKAGMDPRKPDLDGDRPVDYAKVAGLDDLAAKLQSKSQELDLRDKHGINNTNSRRGREMGL